MRRETKNNYPAPSVEDDDAWMSDAYFTYRPLSNLPTPPPSTRDSSAAQSPKTTLEDGEELQAKFRGPAVHLVNLIPSTASPLAVPSHDLVQAMLSRAQLPIETVALAVCILDSLDAKFARTWRLSCPLTDPAITPATTPPTTSSSSKRHTMPPELLSSSFHRQQLHIDAVRPELIVLAALVIAAKFTDDFHSSAACYCASWGRGLWSPAQLTATELCIMARLDYRILPLYTDEDLLADAMVDMQLAARQHDAWHRGGPGAGARLPTPPDTDTDTNVGLGLGLGKMRDETCFVPAHSRSKTTTNIPGPILG